eukprot:TRINITY_DN121_c0_g1_i5.p1 TRINITY_DN121_c0_g1~~TRINITY_DN121_c0_g1_i5.p1  ORF type:complete len:406 (+),score=117.13 TRINITY_DN121_c0_g1_i5:59-1276(+)
MITAAVVAAAAAACSTDLDCSLNGVCTGGKCECDAAWNGTACEKFAILPREPGHTPAYGYSPNVTSWGGGIFKGDDGLYHLFVSEMADDHGNFCGLKEWPSHSRIAHAVAKDPMDVFKKVDVALPQQAHNAAPLRKLGEKGAKWYLFHIGSASGKPVSNCTVEAVHEDVAVESLTGSTPGNFLHVADSPSGPWTPLPAIGCNNPAPMLHNNGTFYVLCNNGGGFKIHRTEDPSKGGWKDAAVFNFPPSWGGAGSDASKYLRNEDPYLYMDKRGNWHALAHRYDYRDGYPPNPNQTEPVLVSGHAFSVDGVNWHFSDVQPYNNWVDYTDGTRRYYATFERPHLVFDDAGELTHLINGVSPVWGDPPCAHCDARPGSEHSCVVCKTSVGVDWDYTLVSPLRTSAMLQ